MSRLLFYIKQEKQQDVINPGTQNGTNYLRVSWKEQEIIRHDGKEKDIVKCVGGPSQSVWSFMMKSQPEVGKEDFP